VRPRPEAASRPRRFRGRPTSPRAAAFPAPPVDAQGGRARILGPPPDGARRGTLLLHAALARPARLDGGSPGRSRLRARHGGTQARRRDARPDWRRRRRGHAGRVAERARQRAGSVVARDRSGLTPCRSDHVFAQLQGTLNRIWRVDGSAGAGASVIWGFLKERLLSIAMVLVIGFLLLVSLLVRGAASGPTEFAL